MQFIGSHEEIVGVDIEHECQVFKIDVDDFIVEISVSMNDDHVSYINVLTNNGNSTFSGIPTEEQNQLLYTFTEDKQVTGAFGTIEVANHTTYLKSLGFFTNSCY